MTEQEFRSYIKILHDEYKNTYGRNSARLAWEKLKECRATAMLQALDKVMLLGNNLPPLQKVIDATLAAENELKTQEAISREGEAQRDKELYRRETAKAFSDKNGIAAKSIDLIRAMLSGSITREKALDDMRRLDDMFPRAGFATEGARLQNYYEFRGLPLGGDCGEN